MQHLFQTDLGLACRSGCQR